MLLGNLFRAMFERGVTLVATSNAPPDDLYKDGLQRARFLPAIRALKERMQVVEVVSDADYRLRLLEQAATWLHADRGADAALARFFETIAGEHGRADATLTLNHRRLHAQRHSDEVVWFTFRELCDGPRGQADYIEIARCYHTVILSDVPVLGPETENQERRFIALVDEFYDRAVKLIISAAAPATELNRGARLAFEFGRTRSRFIEMQCQEYLARPHRPCTGAARTPTGRGKRPLASRDCAMGTELRSASRLRVLPSLECAGAVGGHFHDARRKPPVERAGGLELRALGDQRSRKPHTFGPQRSFHQRLVQQIALRMAAAEAT